MQLNYKMKVQHNTQNHKHYAERMTVFLSALCAVHCMLTPILLVVMPVAAAYFEQYHWVEYILILSVFILGTSSILHGYKHHHHSKIPAYAFFAGLILMSTAAIINILFQVDSNFMHLLSGIGGVSAGVGQLYNLKLSH
ncbi:MAG: hypothetical protein RJA25_1230 [Bacteroidota bacterium]